LEEYFNKLDEIEKIVFLTHGYGSKDGWIYLLNDSKYYNHSKLDKNVYDSGEHE
jgi:hypothetical protein